MSTTKPIVFIGSSREMLAVSRAIQADLDYDAEVVIWNQGVFRPGDFTLEALEKQVQRSDFAILIIGAEDVVLSRGKKSLAPRDNILLEAGMFIGALGRHRCFLLYDRSKKQKIPSDLLGLTPLTYESKGNIASDIGPACEVFRNEIRSLGNRKIFGDSGTSVTYAERSVTSTSYAAQCLRSLDTFAGDLSYLDEDISTYAVLQKRNVKIRFLTDTPTAPVIKKAKKLGMLFRQYPKGSAAPLKATISDADEESEARLLIVRRTIHKQPVTDGSIYKYWMKTYSGPQDYQVIKAMSLLFEELFFKGKPI